MSGTLYILLPVHNRREVTRRFVDCLKAQSLRDYHLVLIDDGSRDGTAEMVRDRVDRLTVITGTGNWWWAGALQQGYRWLQGRDVGSSDLVLIVNDDTEFEPDFLERGVALTLGRERSLLSALIYSRHGRELVDAGFKVDWRRFMIEQAEDEESVACFSSTALFMRASDFLATGGFRPRLLPHYLSDLEFTLRAARKGMRLRLDRSLKLWWDDETTGFRDFKDETLTGYLSRYFSRKSSSNPFAWTAFVALACPWPWKLTAMPRVWAAVARDLLQAAGNSARRKARR